MIPVLDGHKSKGTAFTRRGKRILIAAVIGTFLVTLALTVLLINLSSGGPSVSHPIDNVSRVSDPAFTRTLENVLGPPWADGNLVKPLQNGDEIFPAMLAAIRSAEQSINFETFIYWRGNIAVEFAESLSERARHGVQVRVLLDGVGASTMDDSLIDLMRSAGVIIEFFRPLNWYNLDRMNNRTHRKILVVDGKVGFTGGVGIGDEWLGNAQDSDHWRDSHFEIRGPVVAQLQGGFADHWVQAYHEVIQGEAFF